MVQEIKQKGNTFYGCEECNLIYKEREWAVKCEAFCKKYNMCSLEITKHATQLD